MKLKERLRNNILAQRKCFDKNLDLSQNNIITNNIRELIDALISNTKARNRHVLGLYWSIQGEPDLLELISEGKSLIALPKLTNASMDFVRYKVGMELKNSAFGGLLHPKNNDVLLPDIIVVPALAFSLSGVRLGFGNGYYDRYFHQLQHTPIKIGVCFHNNLYEYLPYEAHDVTMDYIITDKIIIKL